MYNERKWENEMPYLYDTYKIIIPNSDSLQAIHFLSKSFFYAEGIIYL